MKSDTLGRQPRKLAALACSITLIGLLGCGPSGAQDEAAQPKQRPKPSADALRAATHPGYTTPAGTRQECLGRLVFDVQREMQWGINAPGLSSGDRFRFTNDMHGGHDAVHVANLQIVVSAPAKRTDIDRMLASEAGGKGTAIREYRTMIETKKGRIEDLSAVLKDPSKNVNNEDTSNWGASIERIKKEVTDIETSIADIEKAPPPSSWTYLTARATWPGHMPLFIMTGDCTNFVAAVAQMMRRMKRANVSFAPSSNASNSVSSTKSQKSPASASPMGSSPTMDARISKPKCLCATPTVRV